MNVGMIQRTVVGTGLYPGDLGTPAGMGLTIRRGGAADLWPRYCRTFSIPALPMVCMAIECLRTCGWALCSGMPAAFAYFWTSLQNCCRQIANSGSLEFDLTVDRLW